MFSSSTIVVHILVDTDKLITLALQLLIIKLTTFISSGSHELNNNIFLKDRYWALIL